MSTTPDTLSQADKEKIVNFLKKHPVAVLATVDPSGDPHASTIYIGVSDDLKLTFTTKRETQKYVNITKHNKIMLVVCDAKSQTAVQVRGQAVEVTDPSAQLEIYQETLHAAERTGEDVVPPVAKILGSYVGFSIKIDTIWISEYSWGNNFASALQQAQDQHANGDPA